MAQSNSDASKQVMRKLTKDEMNEIYAALRECIVNTTIGTDDVVNAVYENTKYDL